MKLKFLGTGTSQGVPVIGCHDPVCLSEDPKDKRLRTSALITTDANFKILIDCGPDFRQQMLANNEENVHAVVVTHEHNDHIIGLDDLRPLIFKNGKDMPIYCSERVGEEIKERFPYAFAEEKYPGAPSFELHYIDFPFKLLDTEIIPLHIQHGEIPILGYKFRKLAYITDGSFIPEETKKELYGLDVLILNVLRKNPVHHSHFVLPEALKLVEELKPKVSYFVHISHQMGFHEEVEAELPQNVHLAYDGLEIEF